MPSDDLLLLVLNDMMDTSKVKRELKFEGYSDDDVQSCYIYAIEKNLIAGNVFRPVTGKATPNPQRLTAYGQDFLSSLQLKKREVSAVQNTGANPAADVTNKKMNPFATSHIKIFETVVGALVFACIIYLLAQHYGLRLQP